MVAMSLGIVFVIAWCIAWIMSGRSPFLLAALGLLFVEAVRAEVWASTWPAAQELMRRIRVRFAAVRAEIGAEA